MTGNGWLQFLFYLLVLLATTKPLGGYMARVFDGERTLLSPVIGPVERFIYRLGGVDPSREMHWTTYTFALLAFSLVGLLLTYAIERLQGFLPLNPHQFGAASAPSGATPMTPDLAWNTAASFTTNTNWQSYVPEATMSYLTQMVGLTVQNFTSAATGIAIAIAVTRGFAGRGATTGARPGGVGNFWVDLTRGTLYVLLPICTLFALVLVQQGVPQNLNRSVTARTLDAGVTDASGKPITEQVIAQGPVASQVAIKMLGTNGGGFFNANAAHPYENPTPLSNLLQILAIFAISSALTNTFGRMVGDQRQGWALFAAMGLLFVAGFLIVWNAEAAGNPNLARAGADATVGVRQSGGNMEGKEVRFGIMNSALFATVTTAASCGAVNAMHDSFTPLGGMAPLVNIELGEVIFGGVGAGLYGMLTFVVLAVFIAGLMVGRTPEYLGKKIEQKEVKMAMLSVLVLCAGILCFAAWASVAEFPTGAWINPPGPTLRNTNNGGPHGLAEILYAYSSATGNNGSAFAGISANTPFYNTTLGLAMLIGRFLVIIPLLAIAGSLAGKSRLPEGSGTFPTHGPLFVGLLVGVVLIVGALTFFPALSLAPVVEQYQMQGGKLY